MIHSKFSARLAAGCLVAVASISAVSAARADDPQQRSIEGLKEVTTDSGLKYWDIKVGEGASPKATDKVTVHYSGWFKDGKLFDSSVKRGDAATFPLNGVIKGWTEGLQSMKVGGIRRLEIPFALAYGEAGRPPTIPPKSDLIFEVELLDVFVPPPPPTQRSIEGIEPVTMESGLKYWDIKAGDGKSPASASSKVTVHYSGWLKDGKLFDSSVTRGTPATFALNGVIRGWTEGLANMKVGGIRRLEIPYALAYGEPGRPGIPAKADLIFEVELLAVAD